MVFPDSPRVIYAKNPLEQVICQVRFPRILRIDTEVPAEFQDKIRQQFPLFAERNPVAVPPELPKEIAAIFAAEVGRQIGNKAYDFLSTDEQWTVSLTSEFIALTARRYERWEQFKDQLSVPVRALQEVYKPAFCSRIGLRYRDQVSRSRLGLQDTSWAELLSTPILGELGSDVQRSVEQTRHEVLIRLDDHDGRLRVQHGLLGGHDGDQPYIVDADFFTEKKMEIGHATNVLDVFNREAGRFFRWCITEPLHRAMQPRPVS